MQRVSASSVTLTQALASLHTLSINGTGADFTQLHHLVKYFPVLTGLCFFLNFFLGKISGWVIEVHGMLGTSLFLFLIGGEGLAGIFFFAERTSACALKLT